jgi:hypothetical protein
MRPDRASRPAGLGTGYLGGFGRRLDRRRHISITAKRTSISSALEYALQQHGRVHEAAFSGQPACFTHAGVQSVIHLNFPLPVGSTEVWL